MARRMAGALSTVPWLRSEHWDSAAFAGGRVHLGIANPGPQPLTIAGREARVWFDGELYPSDLRHGITPTAEQTLALLEGPTPAIRDADGVFAIAAFDPGAGELVLASDRLGFRPLYWTETADWFAYASEVKALLAIRDRTPELDEASLRQFFAFDYLIGERTWWKGIELVPPASIWRISPRGRTGARYWTFSEIRREPRPEEEVIRELCTHWSAGIAKRARPGATPILLSGGLDSRLVLAELHRQGRDQIAVTFGARGSFDMTIAHACARRAGIPHRQIFLDESNWWDGRDHAIWQTDGLTNAIHLHVGLALKQMREGNGVSLKHSVGDTLFGGSGLYLFGKAALEPGADRNWYGLDDVYLNSKYTANPFFDQREVAEVSRADCAPYLLGPSTDCFILSQGQRRWTITGRLALSGHCEMVVPGVDLATMRLLLGGLTERQRMRSAFYRRFLCAAYPEFYADMPWQGTGRGLAESTATRRWRNLKDRVGRRLGMGAPSREFANYERLVAQAGVAPELAGADLLIDQPLKGAARRALTDPRGSGLDARVILAMRTLETYLRQVVNGGPLGTPPM